MTVLRSPSCALAAVLPMMLAGCSRAPEPTAVAPPPARPSPVVRPATAVSERGAIYSIQEGSAVSFVGSKVSRRHAGGFHSIVGEIVVVDGRIEASRVRAVVDTNSIWTDTEQLTSHLEGGDFLEVESYPWATFISTGLVAAEGGGYVVTGNLDLHGVALPISFPAEIEVTEDEVRASAVFALTRSRFGIDFSGPSDDLIDDQVGVQLEIRAGRVPEES